MWTPPTADTLHLMRGSGATKTGATMLPDGARAGRDWSLVLVVLFLLAGKAPAGSLTGPVTDDGVTATVEDLLQIPPSSGGRPRARINVLKEAPDGSGRLFVNDLRGFFYAIDGAAIHTYMDFGALFPDLKTSPGLASGFVSFAFHPEFGANGRFYTVHSEHVGSTPPNLGPALPTAIAQHSILTEWTASDPASNSFSGTSRELMRIASPHHFHNLGEIAFDPYAEASDDDYGLLYIGAGDFGSVATGQPEQLQRLDTPLGTIMRIDPLGGPFTRGVTTFDYGIPPSNPFANDPDPDTLGEIYAYGVRNAHRIAWDPVGEGAPFASEIGQANVEEIDLLAAGANFGWPEREGTWAIDVDDDPTVVTALPPEDASFGYTYPVVQYDHEEGLAIAGGFVARDTTLAGPLKGKFVFGDVATGRVMYTDADEMRLADDGDPATVAPIHELTLVRDGQETTLLDIVRSAVGSSTLSRVDLRFAQDTAGRIYVTTKQDGWVRTLTPVPEPGQGFLLAVGLAMLFGLGRRRPGRARRR